MTPEDAIVGVEVGASGIFVSNHGGRQLDPVSGTVISNVLFNCFFHVILTWLKDQVKFAMENLLLQLDALFSIVQAVGKKCEVYLDGGVMSGSDVFKAIALGARMVFIGRPALWGLAVAGQDGAINVLKIYKEEVDIVKALAAEFNWICWHWISLHY